MTAGDIYTIAGSASGSSGTTGDGGPAASALLNDPTGVAADTVGDLYVADSGNNRIQEIAAANGTQWSQQMTAGDIYTVAGHASGVGGQGGDGGPATAAHLDNADFVATDPAGSLYITDYHSDVLREVISATGSPFTVSPAGGAVTVTQPGGAQVTFYPQVSGSCTAPMVTAGGYCVQPAFQGAALTSNPGPSTYTFLSSPGADTLTYSWDGQLISDTDTAGNTLAVTYNWPAPGSSTTGTSTPVPCPATATSCQTVTAASGRAIVIGSNASGLITTVTDPMGREWTYAYNAAGDLTSATDPMTNVTSYTYGAGSNGPGQANDLLTITAPNGQPGGPDAGDDTVNVYNAAGQVTRQTDPMGNVTTFSYCVSATSGDCMNPATGSGYVTVTDPDGNKTVYDYTQGTLAAQSDLTGTTVTSENDQVPAATAGGATGGTLLDSSSTDGDGNTSTYAYNTAGSLTTETGPSPSGGTATTTAGYTSALQAQNCTATAEASATCAASPGPAPVSPGGSITPPGSAPPDGLTWSLYDADGNQLYTTTGVYTPGGIYQHSQTSYTLYKGNSVTLNSTNISCTTTPPAQDLPCATINPDDVVTQLGYDAQGDQTSSSTPDGNGSQLATSTNTYDADGERTTQVAPDGNVSGANAGNYTTTTVWNADAEQTSVTQGNGSGYTDTPRTTGYGYDGDGNQTTVQDARGYTTTTTYNADDEATLVTDPDGNASLTCYDGDGNTVQTVPPVGVAANSLSPGSCPTAYPAGYSTRLAADATADTYNADGQVTQETTPAPAGQTGSETTTYTYDGNDNLLTVTAPPTSNSGTSQVTVNTYNSDSQLTAQTTGHGTAAASTLSWCYDPNGDVTSLVYGDGNTSGTAACSTSSPWDITATPQANYQTTYGYDSAGELDLCDNTRHRRGAERRDYHRHLRRGRQPADLHRPRRHHRHLDLHPGEPDRRRHLLRRLSALGQLHLRRQRRNNRDDRRHRRLLLHLQLVRRAHHRAERRRPDHQIHLRPRR